MQPHHQFFTSLKHLEKRLKLENHPSPPAPPKLITPTQQSDSLGTPIFLNYNQFTNTSSSNPQGSEAPNEFLLSTSSDSPYENQSEFNRAVDQPEKSSLDCDIELLMQLLGLSEIINEGGGVDDVGCDDGFYGKIVGVKGPKSAKEVERLEGWIRCFLEGEKKEPLGLAHLLLGKAAFAHSGDDNGDGFGGFVFPCTIDEFLRNDPPVD